MPIFDIECNACGKKNELLVVSSDQALTCPNCGSQDVVRLMSPTSSLTGRQGQSLPGPGDTTCCGSSPAEKGCAGPGSCCGAFNK